MIPWLSWISSITGESVFADALATFCGCEPKLAAAEPAFLCGEPVFASVEPTFLGRECALASEELGFPDCAFGVVVILATLVYSG